MEPHNRSLLKPRFQKRVSIVPISSVGVPKGARLLRGSRARGGYDMEPQIWWWGVVPVSKNANVVSAQELMLTESSG
jgi:hypothetical protein